MEEVKFSTQITTKDMYTFNMRHCYLCISGIIGILISVGAFVCFLITREDNTDIGNLMLLLISALFTIIQPIMTLIKSYQIVKITPVFKKPLNYTFIQDGIEIQQENEKALLPWQDITKVLETKTTIYIYTSPKNAYIMPKVQFVDKVDKIKKYIKEKVDKTKAKVLIA